MRLIQDYLGHRNIKHTVRYTATNPAGKLTRLRPPHKDECCVTAQGWRGREETRPPRHADSFAPAYRPERPLRLRASRGLCSGVRPSTLYALEGAVLPDTATTVPCW